LPKSGTELGSPNVDGMESGKESFSPGEKLSDGVEKGGEPEVKFSIGSARCLDSGVIGSMQIVGAGTKGYTRGGFAKEPSWEYWKLDSGPVNALDVASCGF